MLLNKEPKPVQPSLERFNYLSYQQEIRFEALDSIAHFERKFSNPKNSNQTAGVLGFWGFGVEARLSDVALRSNSSGKVHWLLIYGSNGGIFRRVVEWTWERLLVVSGGPRLTIEGSARNDFLSINRQSWICRASIDRLLCVIYRLVFTALTWSGVSCEAKHVRQVFAKLSSTGQASLSNTSHCRGRGWTLISSGVASLDNVILAVVEALSSILG